MTGNDALLDFPCPYSAACRLRPYVSPEERAKAVAERFAADLASRSVPELERIVTSRVRPGPGQEREGPERSGHAGSR